MSHTATPWQSYNEHEPTVIIGNVDGPDDGRYTFAVIADTDSDDVNKPGVDEANAAHIVKCVNERDGLVQALEDALEFLTGYEDVNDGDYGVPEPNKAMQLCNRIREALGRRPGL